MQKKIEEIQAYLATQEADGWLFYDNHGSNRFVRQVLTIEAHQVLTRRFFYWIPKEGKPQKILHKIESESLNHLPGEKYLYHSWRELHEALKKVLQKTSSVLMEYSPKAANPSVSVVDGGTIEMIRDLEIEVKSSADVLQRFTSVLSEQQIQSHFEAAVVVQTTVANAWTFISECLKNEKKITEYDVQQFILSEFAAQKCVTEEGPCCSVNEHSALPHYTATQESAKRIHPGDFILIDLWCKKKLSHAIYADITRVAVAASEPKPKERQIFNVVFEAQQKGIEFVTRQIKGGRPVKGFEVDDVCRSYIKASGYGNYFTHRTGHNIDTNVHGAGANLDNLETSDHRHLLPGMCFSIEPGIYLINEFGLRLESNLLIRENRTIELTGGIEERVICLL